MWLVPSGYIDSFLCIHSLVPALPVFSNIAREKSGRFGRFCDVVH